MSNTRILRIPLPVELIREMDELVEGNAGGMASRAEFAREAIEAMALELRHGVFESLSSGVIKGDSPPEVPQDGPRGRGTKPVIVSRSEADAIKALAFEGSTTLMSIEETALPEPPAVSYYCSPQQDFNRYMYGMHNRDYPSLWAASQICELTKDGPIPFEDAIRQILPEAWSMGERLKHLDEVNKQQGLAKGVKLSALFPTNKLKSKQSEGVFSNFAIGWPSKNGSEQTEWQGPLPEWKIIGIEEGPEGNMVGMTEVGRQLLQDLSGLTVAQPHPSELAYRFFEHLRQHDPSDWIGFITMMKAASLRLSREKVIQMFANQWPAQIEHEKNTQGYVARGREWGLIEMAQIDRCYVLTDFGESVLDAEQAKEH